MVLTYRLYSLKNLACDFFPWQQRKLSHTDSGTAEILSKHTPHILCHLCKVPGLCTCSRKDCWTSSYRLEPFPFTNPTYWVCIAGTAVSIVVISMLLRHQEVVQNAEGFDHCFGFSGRSSIFHSRILHRVTRMPKAFSALPLLKALKGGGGRLFSSLWVNGIE